MAQNRIRMLLAQMEGGFGGNGWATAAGHALAGLSADQAAWGPAADLHSVWELVNHLTFWKELVTARLHGLPITGGPIRNPETFGSAVRGDEKAWREAVDRLMGAQAALRAAVASLQDEQLDQPLPGERTLLGDLLSGIILHDPYHLGQVVVLRKLMGRGQE